MIDDKEKQELAKRYPYLSIVSYGGNEYIGIIQNADDIVTSIYDFNMLKSNEEKLLFLELAEVWWGESNRLIPINVFLKQDWVIFKPILKTLNSKDVEVKIGPVISLKDMAIKRSKRRAITLVRRLS